MTEILFVKTEADWDYWVSLGYRLNGYEDNERANDFKNAVMKNAGGRDFGIRVKDKIWASWDFPYANYKNIQRPNQSPIITELLKVVM